MYFIVHVDQSTYLVKADEVVDLAGNDYTARAVFDLAIEPFIAPTVEHAKHYMANQLGWDRELIDTVQVLKEVD